jgi:WD40 repeat protein
MQPLEGHTGPVNSVVFSPDLRFLASASHDRTIKLWDPATGQCQQTLKSHSDWVYSVAFSPRDSCLLSSASWDGTVKLWDLRLATDQCQQTLEGQGSAVNTVAFSTDAHLLASASRDGTVKLWDPATGRCQQTLEGHGALVSSVAFSTDSRLLASASFDSTVKLWDPATGRCQQTLNGHKGWVHSVAFSPDARLLASASHDSTVKLWHLATGQCQTLKGHKSWVTSVAFSPDGRLLASASFDWTIKLWYPTTGRCQQTLKGHKSPVNSVAFSANSCLLASASDDGTVRLWPLPFSSFKQLFKDLFKGLGPNRPDVSITIPKRKLLTKALAEEGRTEPLRLAEISSVQAGVTLDLANARVVRVADSEAPPLGINKDSLRGILDLQTSFKYLPLQEGRFRLLSLVAPGDYPICTVKDYALDEAPPYAAMSYAWGLPIQTRAMFCKNAQSPSLDSFSISEHVLEALNSLHRYVPQGLKIWIDAICIDQNNSAEKAHQIAAMPRIYSQAEVVLCWLGAEADNSGLVIDDLPTLGDFAQDLTATMVLNLGDVSLGSSVAVRNGQRLVEVARFFRRPWFHRLWVIQEMLLARELTLVCGRKTVSWDTLFKGAEQLSCLDIGTADVSPRLALQGIVELGRLRMKAKGALVNGLSQPEFLRIMLWSRMRQVTEPVDRIWALMGLTQPDLRDSVSSLVDYSQHGRSNFFETYKAFARKFLLQDERLWMLSLIALTPRDENLPSWCPNFCHDPHDLAQWRMSLLQRTDEWYKLYNAGYSDELPITPSLRFLSANEQLAISGFVVDRVRSIRTPSATADHMMNDQYRLIFDNMCLEVADEVFNDPDRAINAHSRTVIADRTEYMVELGGQDGDEDVVVSYVRWRKYLMGDPCVRLMSDVEKEGISMYDIYAKISIRRSYIATENGRLGLAPMGTEVGDLICIMYGANTPYVVRSNGYNKPMTLIGDAYVDGIMYGEALLIPERRSNYDIIIR